MTKRVCPLNSNPSFRTAIAWDEFTAMQFGVDGFGNQKRVCPMPFLATDEKGLSLAGDEKGLSLGFAELSGLSLEF